MGSPMDLLQLVGSGAQLLGRLTGSGDRAAPDAARFERLLADARKADADTGRVVVVGRGVQADLSADQLQRVARATDQAEARGASSAAVLLDGLVLRVDVASRTIVESASATTASLTGVDAVIAAGEPEAPAASAEDLLRALSPATGRAPGRTEDG